MGTRNLTAVYSDGDYKVAQYGQWDGYPSGQGRTVLDFLRKVNIDTFKQKLSNVYFRSQSELEACDEILAKSHKEVSDIYPELSRDTGAEILGIIYNSTTTVGLKNKINFAGDSLFCEWAYVIDLDKMTFEVYAGFNTENLSETDRFYCLTNQDEEYKPVKKVACFSLNSLPSEEEFLETCEPTEEE